ncbi:MAG: endolytic transglycosylase MltG [Treponema sp.]|jgi:UPF0755 protein|nr:endolytic transglycosylase MltG [Treponema sp.]
MKEIHSGTLPYGLRLFFVLLSGIIAAVLILAALAAGILVYGNAPPKKDPHPAPGSGISLDSEEKGTVLFEITEGESAYSVGRRLERAGLIKTRYFWNLLSRVNSEYIKAGSYRLKYPASQTEIHAALIKGQQVMLRATIPEGVTLKKAAHILGEAGICLPESFIAAASDGEILKEYNIPGDTLEGYLYPETYFFPASYPAAKVVRTMADTFFDRIHEIEPVSADLSPGELNKIIIIASIVEREYRVPDEAALMAGVFYNRIQINMALQSCATVEYIITDILGKPHPRVLYNSDIEIDNPYNTYIIPGLPPGPISLPGKTALSAAFHPAESNYLYFRLIDETAGRHYFSRTLDDHIKAGRLFVKGSS